MTVKELRKALLEYPADAEVYIVDDYGEVQDGNYTEISKIEDVGCQHVYEESGLDWEDVPQVILFPE